MLLRRKPRMRGVICLGTLFIGVCSWAHDGAATSQSAPPKDDLIWLESPHYAKALAWAKQQTDQTTTRLQALPDYPQVKAELAQVLENHPAQRPDVVLLGHRAIRHLRDQEHPFGVLQLANLGPSGVPGTWRTVPDIAVLRKQEGVPYELQDFLAHRSTITY